MFKIIVEKSDIFCIFVAVLSLGIQMITLYLSLMMANWLISI